ncbi:hypothetical protein MXMO3_01687 [Maritalea myrionectae]|uniref:Uncharacterized protein n=1 Tax=Maritalea myrionectae TaxID=454601 RepID=A0A2R4ME11_9HYPH|nr:hypothetical protein [Maritalea myrionectae]AVX04213.1 hypothetical protein MXMO3_01687 [Maritalea myrionectae]
MTNRPEILAVLFDWLQVPPSKSDDTVGYLQKLEEVAIRYPESVLQVVVEDFKFDRVEGQSTTWLPDPVLFAKQCNKRNELNVWREKRARINSEINADRALTYQPPQETPEQRQAAYERCMAKLNLPGEEDQFEQRVKAQSEDYVPDNGIQADYDGLPHPQDPRPLAERLKIGAGGNYATRNTKAAPEFQKAGDLAKGYAQ